MQCINQNELEKVFQKILTRLQQWQLFDDEETKLASKSLRMITKQGPLINFMNELSLKKMFQLFAID